MSNLQDGPETIRTGLHARLNEARRRSVLRAGLRGGAWSALAAAVLTVSVKLASLSGEMSGLTPGEEWGVGAVALVIGLLLTGARSWRTRPDLLEMARRADQRFGLDDRLSTALEFQSRSDEAASTPPVLAALFQDAASHSDRVDPQKLVPLEIPKPAVVFAVIALCLLALEVGSPGSRALPTGTDAFAEAVDRDPETAAGLIRDLAALLREQANSESSEPLRVVATSLEQLAAAVTEQAQGGEAVADALADLLAQADVGSDAAEAAGELDDSPLTLANIEAFLQEHAEAVARADAFSSELSDLYELTAGEGTTPTDILTRAQSAVEALRTELPGVDADSTMLAIEPTIADSLAAEELEIEAGSTPSMNAAPATGDRPLANSNVGGVADDSDTGGGAPTDGLGGGSTLAQSDRVEVPDVSSSRDFELPMEGGSRRRLPDEIVPQTRFTEVEETALPRGTWERAPQQQRSSGYIGISHRDVASRYFLSRIRLAELEAEAESGAP